MSTREQAKLMSENNFFYEARVSNHRNPYHFEDDLLVVLDLELTGTDPFSDSMLGIKILPVDGLKFDMSSFFTPLHIPDILPENIESFNPKKKLSRERMTRLLDSNIDLSLANHLFIDWFKGLSLQENSRLIPVCFNWADYRGFLIKLCGSKAAFERIFNQKRVIDINAINWFIEDLSWSNGEKYPFNYMASNPEVSMMKKLEVVRMNKINTYARCFDLLECYRKLRTLTLPVGVDIK